MNLRACRRTALLSWLFVGALLVVCATLGILQYRWISEVNVAARDRMREGLRANLARLNQDFNSEISTGSAALARLPGQPRRLVVRSAVCRPVRAVEEYIAARGPL